MGKTQRPEQLNSTFHASPAEAKSEGHDQRRSNFLRPRDFLWLGDQHSLILRERARKKRSRVNNGLVLVEFNIDATLSEFRVNHIENYELKLRFLGVIL